MTSLSVGVENIVVSLLDVVSEDEGKVVVENIEVPSLVVVGML